jgi:hypothetical protein
MSTASGQRKVAQRSTSRRRYHLHAYKCPPHLDMGMVGLIQVGDTVTYVDLAKAAELPDKAKGRMKALLAKAGVAVSN